jgi:hypothetical protein
MSHHILPALGDRKLPSLVYADVVALQGHRM